MRRSTIDITARADGEVGVKWGIEIMFYNMVRLYTPARSLRAAVVRRNRGPHIVFLRAAAIYLCTESQFK